MRGSIYNSYDSAKSLKKSLKKVKKKYSTNQILLTLRNDIMAEYAGTGIDTELSDKKLIIFSEKKKNKYMSDIYEYVYNSLFGLVDEDDVDCLSSNRYKISQTHTTTLSLSSTTSNLFKFRERRNICIKEEKTNSFHKKKQPIKDKIVKTIVGTIADKNVNYLDYALNSYRPLNSITNSTTPNKPE